jgi:hypothetical protein
VRTGIFMNAIVRERISAGTFCGAENA